MEQLPIELKQLIDVIDEDQIILIEDQDDIELYCGRQQYVVYHVYDLPEDAKVLYILTKGDIMYIDVEIEEEE